MKTNKDNINSHKDCVEKIRVYREMRELEKETEETSYKNVVGEDWRGLQT